MIAGFSGPVEGMSQEQWDRLAREFLKWGVTDLHFGNAPGADFDAWLIARLMGIHTWSHPSNLTGYGKRPMPTTGHFKVYPPEPPLIRNGHIVLASDVFFATPKEYHEVIRSGTWASIRYARRNPQLEDAIVIIYPDGSTGT